MKKGQHSKGRSIPNRCYSESFKIKIVKEVEHGLLTKEHARKRYGIKGKSAVLYWCRKYGRENYPIMKSKNTKNPSIIDEKDKKIIELETRLKESQLKIDALESLIEVANEQYGTDLKKKVGLKQRKK
jgi:transposase